MPAEVVQSLIASLLPMLSQIMLNGQLSEAQIVDAERHIKVFLSCVKNFNLYRTKQQKLLWASSYNFISLLNLPVLMRKYGSLRMLWEGGGKGEGALRLLKRLIVNGLKGTWAFCTALCYLKEKAMKYMLRASVDATEWDTENRPTVKEMLKVARSIIGDEDDDKIEGQNDDNGVPDGYNGKRFGDYNAYTDI
jgi:hypothetical protein